MFLLLLGLTGFIVGLGFRVQVLGFIVLRVQGCFMVFLAFGREKLEGQRVD